MGKTIKKTTLMIMLTVTIAMVCTTIAPNSIYADSKSSVKSYKNSIKSYNTKTKKLYKNTPAAKKYYKKTKSYYKKSKKTGNIKTLRKYKKKAKNAYTSARRLDYNRQVGDVYKNIKAISNKAPSMDSFVTKATSIYNKAKSTKSISSKKKYLGQIRSLSSQAQAHKAALSWYDAEYRQEYVPGSYKTVVVQEAEYVYSYTKYYKAVANGKGFRTGELYDNWDIDKCLANGSVFPAYKGNSTLAEWGVQVYQDSNENVIRPIEDRDAYSSSLSSKGISTQVVGTCEWFQTKERITKQQWVEPYYKNVLVREAGWY